MRILTSDLAPPFVETSPRGEGLTAKIVNSALAAGAAASDPGVEIAYVNDRSAHLRDLLDRGSFAMGFPWAMPSCAHAALATSMPLEAWKCGAFELLIRSMSIFSQFWSAKPAPFN